MEPDQTSAGFRRFSLRGRVNCERDFTQVAAARPARRNQNVKPTQPRLNRVQQAAESPAAYIGTTQANRPRLAAMGDAHMGRLPLTPAMAPALQRSRLLGPRMRRRTDAGDIPRVQTTTTPRIMPDGDSRKKARAPGGLRRAISCCGS